MDSNIKLRILTGDDAEIWRVLRLEAIENEPEAFSSCEEDHHKLTLAEIKSRISSDTSNFVFGAFIGDRLLGMAGFYRDKGRKSEHKGHVWGVYVTREARGKGVGRALMNAVIERGTQVKGIDLVEISVAVTQTAATELYRSLGFETFGREPCALKVNGRYIDEEHMVMFVNRP